MSVRLLVGALALQFMLAGIFIWFAVTGFPFLPSHAASATEFDAQRAYADVRSQVARGPRPAGSAASRRLADWLRTQLPNGRLESVPGGLRNVVGSLPGRQPAIVVAAHYDTKDLPGFVGANDGAGGTAVVLELARVLAHDRPKDPRAIDFVLFDGEESPPGTPSSAFTAEGLRGSRAYARAHATQTSEAIVLDFVGQENLKLLRDAGSDPALWARLRAAAKRAGVASAFPPGTTSEVRDDDTPFARAGVPAIDLIDLHYPCFHLTCDDLSQIDQESLDSAGEAVEELVRGDEARH
jgi:acetylornithine deacetylase/succinyl-diaminopimelate desuccinylase-like protein